MRHSVILMLKDSRNWETVQMILLAVVICFLSAKFITGLKEC